MLWIVSIVLALNALFAFVVWPRFLPRITVDPRSHDASGAPTRFLRVHQVLIATALSLAAVSAVVAVLGFVFAVG